MADRENPSMGILAAARRLQEAKIGAVARVVESRDNIARIQAELADAQREDGVAYAAAIKAGWTEAELRQVGIAPPVRKAPGRPRTQRRREHQEENMPRVRTPMQREAEASVALDRDQTHVVQ